MSSAVPSRSAAVQPRPLDNVTVIDMGQLYAAPYATLLMALNGARVIKVEPPAGEALRQRGSVKNTGAEVPFYMLNSDKQSVTLNIKDSRGQDLLRQLVGKADVFVENFRPGMLEKYRLGADDLRNLHPSLIYASCSGYGKSGAYSDMLAMDLTVQAMAGVMSTTGFIENPPVKAGPAIADMLGGIHLFGGIVTALYRRTQTGEGATIDVALLEAVIPSFLSNLGLMLGNAVPPPERTGNRHGGLSVVPYNVYPTIDGHISILSQNDSHWVKLTAVIGVPELGVHVDYATGNARVVNMDEVDRIVGEWTSTRSTRDAFETLRKLGVPSAPVRTLREVIDDPHLRERELIYDRDVPDSGILPLLHSPIRFEKEPRQPPGNSPGLGEHNNSLYEELLGLSDSDIAELRSEGVL